MVYDKHHFIYITILTLDTNYLLNKIVFINVYIVLYAIEIAYYNILNDFKYSLK